MWRHLRCGAACVVQLRRLCLNMDVHFTARMSVLLYASLLSQRRTQFALVYGGLKVSVCFRHHLKLHLTVFLTFWKHPTFTPTSRSDWTGVHRWVWTRLWLLLSPRLRRTTCTFRGGPTTCSSFEAYWGLDEQPNLSGKMLLMTPGCVGTLWHHCWVWLPGKQSTSNHCSLKSEKYKWCRVFCKVDGPNVNQTSVLSTCATAAFVLLLWVYFSTSDDDLPELSVTSCSISPSPRHPKPPNEVSNRSGLRPLWSGEVSHFNFGLDKTEKSERRDQTRRGWKRELERRLTSLCPSM